jgi:hypothetical protein
MSGRERYEYTTLRSLTWQCDILISRTNPAANSHANLYFAQPYSDTLWTYGCANTYERTSVENPLFRSKNGRPRNLTDGREISTSNNAYQMIDQIIIGRGGGRVRTETLCVVAHIIQMDFTLQTFNFESDSERERKIGNKTEKKSTSSGCWMNLFRTFVAFLPYLSGSIPCKTSKNTYKSRFPENFSLEDSSPEHFSS